MVIDAHERAAPRPGAGAEIHGRLAAVASDLDDGSERCLRAREIVQPEAFLFVEESLACVGDGERSCVHGGGIVQDSGPPARRAAFVQVRLYR